MSHEIGVEVVLFRQRQLQHDQLLRRQTREAFLDCSFEERFGFGFVGAVNIDLRFDNWHKPGIDNRPGQLELLVDNRVQMGAGLGAC